MKLDDVYKAWISVKKRQVKTSSLASYQPDIREKAFSNIRMYGSWGIEQKGYCAIHERSYG